MTRNVILVRVGGALQIAGTPPNAGVGTAYSYTFNIVGGISPFTVTHSTLPGWMSFSASGSQITISGTPAIGDVGPDSFSITVTDAGRNSVTSSYTMQVVAVPLSVTGHLPNSTQSVAITPYSYTATGGYGGYTFSITAGALPTGLSMNSSGVVSGTPSAQGSYSWTVDVYDGHSHAQVPDSCSVAAPPLTITGTFASPLYDGVAYSQSITISNGTAPYSSPTVASGSLPQGLSLSISGSNLILSGTCTQGTTSTFTVSVHDSVGAVATSSSQSLTRQDQHYADVLSLLHLDGSNGATSVTDQSGVSWTFVSGPALSTTNPLYGSACLDGASNTGGCIKATGSIGSGIGTGDCTIEYAYRSPTPSGTAPALFTVSGGPIVGMYLDNSNQLQFWLNSSGVLSIGTFAANTYHRIALVRISGVWFFYVDGSRVGSSSGYTYTGNLSGLEFMLMNEHDLATPYKGKIDEWRVTKYARYSGASYTVAADAFPNS